MRNVAPQPALMLTSPRLPSLPRQRGEATLRMGNAVERPAIELPQVPTAAVASLRQLAQFRWVAVAAQIMAVTAAYVVDVALPYGVMIAVVATVAGVNLLLSRRLHQPIPTTHLEVFWHLFVDLAALTLLLALSGGARNPFAVLYFLHVVLVALLLPGRMVAVGTAIAIALWLVAAELALPLLLRDGTEVPARLLVPARWFSVACTATMIAWFVARIRAALQAQEHLLLEVARKAQNDEAVMRIGTVAAGAAHELATPLMSMSVVIKEWQRAGAAEDFGRDVGILASQIEACKEALSHLRAAARATRWEAASVQPLDVFVNELVGRCRAMRPDVKLRSDVAGPAPAPCIAAEPALKQAILVLLNNAADASPGYVHMATAWHHGELDIEVTDRGPGIPPERLGDVGRRFFTTKPAGQGNGLGVILTASTIERLGGSVKWCNRPGGGACAHVRLPLSGLQHNPNRDEPK